MSVISHFQLIQKQMFVSKTCLVEAPKFYVLFLYKDTRSKVFLSDETIFKRIIIYCKTLFLAEEPRFH